MKMVSAIAERLGRLALVLVLAGITVAAVGVGDTGSTLAADATPDSSTVDIAPQAAPDEGGTGVNNYGPEEWVQFAVMLAPFLVLVTFILILVFKWDSHAGNED